MADLIRGTILNESCVCAYPPARKCCHDLAGSQVVVVDVDMKVGNPFPLACP